MDVEKKKQQKEFVLPEERTFAKDSFPGKDFHSRRKHREDRER